MKEIRNMIKKIVKGKIRNIFDIDLKKEIEYLHSFKEPKDLIERSYFQYKCQSFSQNRFNIIKRNIFSIFILIPFILTALFKGFFLIKKNKKKSLTIFIFSGVDHIVPSIVKERNKEFLKVNFGEGWFFVFKDFKYILSLMHYIKSPYFILKVIYKMAMYRNFINRYAPQTIVCSSEYSFSSSFLTWYCNQNNVEHINVMHGEKLLNIRDSFFQFNEYYVWDTYYVDLFEKLRANKAQFKIAIPQSLVIKSENIPLKYDITYYLGAENIQEMIILNKLLLDTYIPNNKICIRPHPRYSNMKEVESVFTSFDIQDVRKTSIEHSIGLTKMLCSLYSTVLLQGLCSGKEIVVDDITDKNKFEKLQELGFIILNKPHKLLSSFIQ